MKCKDCKHANSIEGRSKYLHCGKFDVLVRKQGECTMAFMRLMRAFFKIGGNSGKGAS